MIFRSGGSMTVLEIVQPFEYIPFHYIMMAKILGFSYDVMMGDEGTRSRSGGFRVSVKELEDRMQRLFS